MLLPRSGHNNNPIYGRPSPGIPNRVPIRKVRSSENRNKNLQTTGEIATGDVTIHYACAAINVNWRLHPALPVDVRLLGAGLIALGASYYYYGSEPALGGASGGDGSSGSGAAGGGGSGADSEHAGKLGLPSGRCECVQNTSTCSIFGQRELTVHRNVMMLLGICCRFSTIMNQMARVGCRGITCCSSPP